MNADGKRVALISGGSRGIGKALIDVFTELGADVVFLHLRELTADDTSGSVRAVRCDVRDFEAVRRVVEEIEAKYGQVHYLVNNAGVRRDRALFQMDQDEWRDVLETNLSGAFHLCRSSVLKMMKRGFGRIINISSISAVTGAAGQCNYAAAKAGLIGLTKSLAREVAAFNVTCNAIAPGYVETDMLLDLPEAKKSRFRELVPAGRFGAAKEICSAVRFLAAEDSSYVNGSVIKIDGGMV